MVTRRVATAACGPLLHFAALPLQPEFSKGLPPQRTTLSFNRCSLSACAETLSEEGANLLLLHVLYDDQTGACRAVHRMLLSPLLLCGRVVLCIACC